MSLMVARGLGYAARRFAPRLFRNMARSYARNPVAWHRGYNAVRGVARGVAGVTAVKGMLPVTKKGVRKAGTFKKKINEYFPNKISADGDTEMSVSKNGKVGDAVYR